MLIRPTTDELVALERERIGLDPVGRAFNRRGRRGARYGGGGSTWTPTAVAGLFLWLEADRGIVPGAASSFGGFESEFDNAYWTKTNVTVSANADGIADKIVETAINATHILSRSPPTNFGNNAYVQRLSVEAKMDGRRWLRVSGNTGAARGWFDLQTGTLGSSNAVDTFLITDLGNGYYRCEISYQATDGDIRYTLSNADTGGAAPSYLGDGVSGILMRNASVLQQRVNTWTDQETLQGTHDATIGVIGEQPAHQTHGGRPPRVVFDGVAGSDSLLLGGAAADWKFLHDGTGGWMFVVVRPYAGGGTILDEINGTGVNLGISLTYQATENFTWSLSNAGANIFLYVGGAGSAPANQTHLISAGYLEDGTGSEGFARLNRAYVLGPQASAGAPNAGNPLSVPRIGERATTNTANFPGEIMAILMYKRASKLTAGEIAYIENGLRAKWGSL